MTNRNKTLKKVVASVSKTMVKMANGTASANYVYQPKKPDALRYSKKNR